MQGYSAFQAMGRGLLGVALVFMTGVLGQGCSSVAYSGPELPPQDEAVVRTSGMACVNGTTIFAVDNTKFSVPRRGVRIAAGVHRLTVGKDYVRNSDRATHIQFKAEAGHRYLLASEERASGSCRFWVEDRANGEVVGE